MASCDTTLPASWYTSKAIYDLERRGIFMKYIIRRASPDWETTKVLLKKDGSEARTHLTSNGLLFVTFSEKTVPFDEYFPGLAELIVPYTFSDITIRRPLHYPVEYNWKAMIDGYQECLHCAYAHPKFSRKYAPQTYKVINHHNYSRHITSPVGSEAESAKDGVFIYLFPNSTLSVHGGGITSWRACPSEDPRRAVMDFDYYHKEPLGASDFEEFFRFTRHVALEDIQLCEKAQQNLNVGIYTAGVLNPVKENGVAYYQGRVLEMCSDQYKKEQESTEARKEQAAWQQVKSRDGCTTCKAKRRKCDEAKPNCSQCLRRRITCGGYSKELTWRHEGFENPLGPKPAICSSAVVDSGRWLIVNASRNQERQEEEGRWHTFSLENNYHAAGVDTDMDFGFLFSDFTSSMALPEDLSLNTQQPLDSEETASNSVPCAYASGGHDMSTEFSNVTLDASEDSSHNLPKQGLLDWYHPLNISEDSPETIASVFNHRICEVLCIVNSSTNNPWRQIVWPLAQKYLPLYHAIAAMTCFSGMPHLRAEGFRHLETSIQKLSYYQQRDGSDSIPLEVTATTLLALAMAKTWYYPRSYNGIAHLKKARGLIQALSKNPPGSAQTDTSNTSQSMRFLINTWMYMDVLTRITSSSADDPPDDIIMEYNSTTSISISDVGSDNKPHIDPLMGCANTLFPLIGRVADLVGRVRRSTQKTSTPTMVSTAVDLLTAIDNWTPSLLMDDLSSNSESELNFETITSSFSDLYQTAIAYKWATLLLLYQAVPELPSRFSHSDIARKILVFIATVPLSSKAVFFPIFPLMVAGCEAADAEDREWVKKRWRSLSTLNGSGIADRCLELTVEVWRRRDEYITQTDGSCAERGSILDNTAVPNVYTQHSVKSEIHWLSVMKEWGWEVRESGTS
ncbi:fungal-specific transcription factor domain-containing protein [Aspergillus venezuelensis]